MRIILDVDDPEQGLLAWRAAKALIRDGHDDAIYAYENGESFWAKRTKSGVSSRINRRAQTDTQGDKQ